MISAPTLCKKVWVTVLVYEETANDLHREQCRIEKSRHFVYVRALITHCACWSRVKFCALMGEIPNYRMVAMDDF